jgi:hypothetical protein
MKTADYDERQVVPSSYRIVPALAWLGLFAFFAIAGTMSRDEPSTMSSVAPATNETAGPPAGMVTAPRAQDPALRNASSTARETPDPAGMKPVAESR